MVGKKRVSFWAVRKIPVPVNVRFRDKYGRRVSFEAIKRVPAPVRVIFYAKKRKGR